MNMGPSVSAFALAAAVFAACSAGVADSARPQPPDAANGAPIENGPVVKLLEVNDMERCRFERTFLVPRVEPGNYVISVFVWDDEGYGFFLPHRFTVADE